MAKSKNPDEIFRDIKLNPLELKELADKVALAVPCQYGSTHKLERQRARHKPYDPVDTLNLDRLSISAKKPRLLKPSTTIQTSCIKKKVPERHHKHSLIQPSKLHIPSLSPHSISEHSNSKSSKFDFAALAAEIPSVTANTSNKPTYNFNNLRVSEPVEPSVSVNRAASLFGVSGEDDELGCLSRLSIDTESATMTHSSSRAGNTRLVRSCSQEAMFNESDFTAEELAYYFDELVYIPKKMSEMAEMMYT